MKKSILVGLFIASAMTICAQTKNVVVELGGTNTAYSDLPSAIAAAPNGATVYIPGGLHTLTSNITISKQLHFRGDGFNPLTLAGGQAPQISGSGQLIFTRGAHYSSFEGIYFSNQVTLQHTTADTTGYFYLIFNRCRFDQFIYSTGGSVKVKNITLFMNECVVYGFNFNGSTVESLSVKNSIFTNNGLYNINQTTISNSILLNGITDGANSSNNVTISNCISYGFFAQYSLSTNWTATNCLIRTGQTISGTIATSNIQYQDWNLIFENGPSNTFNITYDYHLKSGSLGLGAGTDGTDLGIYGGPTPWKGNSIPASPNVYNKSVDTRNDANGKIDVMYKVKAQSN